MMNAVTSHCGPRDNKQQPDWQPDNREAASQSEDGCVAVIEAIV
jgi:hypothetical protein